MADKTLTDVVNELRKQNSTLVSVKDRLESEAKERAEYNKQLTRDAEENKRKNREKERESKKGSDPKSFTGNVLKGAASVIPGVGTLGDFFNRAMGFMFGAGTLAALKAGFGKLLGRGLGVAGLVVLWKTFNEGIFDGFFNLINEYLPTSISGWMNDNRGQIQNDLDNAMTAGLVGLMFGKRIGLVFFAGSLLGSLINDAFVAAGFDPDTKIATPEFLKKLGVPDIPLETLTQIGGIFAALIGPKLIGSVMRFAFFGSTTAAAGTAATAAVTTSVASSFKSRLIGGARGVAGGLIFFTLGQILGEALENITGSAAIGEAVNVGFGLLGIRSMFGPYGALIAGLAYVAYKGVEAVAAYVEKAASEIRAEALSKAMDNLTLAKIAASEGNDEEAKRLITQAKALIAGESFDPAMKAMQLKRIAELQRELGYTDDAALTAAEGTLSGLQQSGNAERIAKQSEVIDAVISAELARLSTMSDPQRAAQSVPAIMNNLRKEFTTLGSRELSRFFMDPANADVLKDLASMLKSNNLAGYKQSDIVGALSSSLKVGEDGSLYIEGLGYHSAPKGIFSSSGQSDFNLYTAVADTIKSKPVIDGIVKGLSEYQERSSVSPPIVMNTTDASTNVSNQQSMVTNNGPVVDISDSMIMRHGAPPAL